MALLLDYFNFEAIQNGFLGSSHGQVLLEIVQEICGVLFHQDVPLLFVDEVNLEVEEVWQTLAQDEGGLRPLVIVSNGVVSEVLPHVRPIQHLCISFGLGLQNADVFVVVQTQF